MKRILSLLLAFALVMCFTPVIPLQVDAATVASGTCGDNLTWTLDDEGTLTISGIGEMPVPEYDTMPWLEYQDAIKHVIIESGVTSICYGAFSWYRELTSVTIPNSVTSIGEYAFYKCTGLTELTIPDSVTSIGEAAFSACSGLTAVKISEGITAIGFALFSGCSSLTSVTIPDSVTVIETEAFSSCSGLTSVTLGSGVISIEDNAFIHCSKLADINIPYGVISIGESAFKSCSQLKSLDIPDSVTSLGDSAFYGCGELTTVTIGNGITSIGDSTFYYCSKLTGVTLGDSITSIGDNAFSNCQKLPQITIPDGVTSIGESAFNNDLFLESISIPNSVTSIGDSAFYGCIRLTDVYYGGTERRWDMMSIGASNSWLTSAAIHYSEDDSGDADDEASVYDIVTVDSSLYPESDHNYGSDLEESKTFTWAGAEKLVITFSADTKVEDSFDMLYLYDGSGTQIAQYTGAQAAGESVEIIGDTFIIKLVSDFVTEEYGYSFSSIAAYMPKSNTCEEYLVWEVVNDQVFITDCDESISGDIVIPGTLGGYPVISIYMDAFSNCTGITGVTILEGTNAVSKGAFSGCENLKSAVLPNSVELIGDYAFENCTSLESITIPENVGYIGREAFYNCSSLTDVIIKGAIHISSGAFLGCNNLNGIWVNENNEYYSSDSSGVLYNKDMTKLITVPGGLAGTYTIADSVTAIGYEAFGNCSKLTEVVIPASVTSIESGAFLGCTALRDVSFGGTRTQWEAVVINNNDGRNDALLNAAIHCKGTVEYQYEENGETVTESYDTLKDALTAPISSAINIKLLADATVDTVVLKPGVTLDLNGHTLTADMLIAMNGAKITGDGILKIAKENLALDRNNGGVIPVWNGVDGYVFTKVSYQQMTKTAGDGTAQYIFLPTFSNTAAASLLADGGADNAVHIKVGLTWNDGQCQQFYTYSEELVSQVLASGGKLVFSLTITGIAGISDMTASAMIVTDSGAQATNIGTAIQAG